MKRPGLTLQIFDESSTLEEMAPLRIVKGNGDIVLKYKTSVITGTADFDDPLGLAIAETHGGVVRVGMALARIVGDDDGDDEKYRVLFEDGPGWLTDRSGITEMRKLYLESPNLVPVVVEVVVGAVDPNKNPPEVIEEEVSPDGPRKKHRMNLVCELFGQV